MLSSVSFSLLSLSQTQGNVENVTLTGSLGVNATGNGLDNDLTGNAGGNTLTGNAGNDRLDGGAGNDRLFGGANNDTYLFSGAFGIDAISEVGGTDKIVLSGPSVLRSAVRNGNDLELTLSTGSITIDNHYTTGTVESFQNGATTVVLATGLTGGDLPGIIAGSSKSETLDGRGGDDLLYGGNGRDTLLGGTGNDLLDGGDGRDWLDGGVGDDLLTGGHGPDTFVFRPGYGHDTITDFRLFEDRLDISGFDALPDVVLTQSGVDLDFGGADVLTIEWDGAHVAAGSDLINRLAGRWLGDVLDTL